MKKILIGIIAIIMGSFVFVPPMSVFAAKEGDPCKCADGKDGVVIVDTSILSGCDCSGAPGGEESIGNLMHLILDILSIGVGILGVVGISVVGTQYLTAGGNEEKTRKAKRRLFEIVIGLVAYVVIYAFLRWLNPAMP